MEKSKVYFTNFRTPGNVNLLQKLETLIKTAGIEQIDFQDKFAAIKIHFGEPGNLAYLRPNFSKVVVDVIKSRGGKPFLTDCNTLYVGRRKNALEHLDAAYENGYNPFTTNCHMIIADGLKGHDEALVPVPHGEYVKEAKIGQAIMDADIFISLNHFKGHVATGFGGALKNIGMGCGSRAGKMEMHSSGKPVVNHDKCVGCKACQRNCAHEAILFEEKKARINHDVCAGCGRCISHCSFDAIEASWDEARDILNRKIAEYSYAVLNGRAHFHISLIVDVSPGCDCHSWNDMPIVPNVGMVASVDPVALDQACVDLVNQQSAIHGSRLGDVQCQHHDHDHNDNPEHHQDHFTTLHPDTNWKACIEQAVKLGLGTKEYELITL